MSTTTFVILSVLFVVSAGLIIVNLTGDPGIDYWDLDGEETPQRSKLDALRNKPVLYSAGAVLIGTFFAYQFLRQ